MAKIAISEDCRQMIKEAREHLGLTQRALEKQTRLGYTYVSYVESGRTQSTESATLARLLKALQQQAEKAPVPAKLKAGLLRAAKSVEKQGEKAAKR